MKEHEKPMHIITALLADESVFLGQITVESKSNEIPVVKREHCISIITLLFLLI